MLRIFAGLAAVFWAGAACAADKPQYGSPPSWVKPASIPDVPADDAAPVQLLLQDSQTRFSPDGDQFYVESAARITSTQGLAQAGTINETWDPQTEKLTLHKLRILRGGQVIDLLNAGKRFTVLRRETNLERAVLDGRMTATLQLEDLRVGDTIDMAMTLQRKDPVMRGFSQGAAGLAYLGVAGRVRIRALWTGDKPIRWKVTEGLGQPAVTTTPQGSELNIDLANVAMPKPPQGAPLRFFNLGQIQLSQFADWSQVSALVAPLYAKAATLRPDSPLKAEADKIRNQTSDPKAQAAAALRLVEEQTRYVFLGMNQGGYVPADADLTWSRRFGDCKGKTVLLLALLRELGIEAQPALVSIFMGDGLDQRLPAMMFDHVIVRATVAGKVYWLDGTRMGDRDLDSLPPPEEHWALPVQATGAALEKLDVPPYAEPQGEITVRLDASAGLDAPAPAHLEHLYRFDEAISTHLELAAMTHADADRELRETWASAYPWISITAVGFDYDPVHGVTRTWADGQATMDWAGNGPVRDFDIGESNLGFSRSFKREPGPNQDAPYLVNYPRYEKWTVRVLLPQSGAGYTMANAPDEDRTIAGVAYWRRSRIEDGVAIMEATERSIAPEFPFTEAKAAETALRELTRNDVAVRTPYSLVVTADPPDPDNLITPTDAAGFTRRGANFMAAKDYDHAIADFGRAVELEPKVAKHVYNRGVAHYLKHEDDLALADFGQALRLDPRDVLALAARGRLLLVKGEEAQARKDLDQAVQLSPGDIGVLLRRADAYAQTDRFEAAISYYDQLITRYPDDKEMPGAIAERCLLKAKSGLRLESAQADCDMALKLKPAAPGFLQTRAFLNLRLGRYDAAIADYGQALDQSAKSAKSLYGRGIAEMHKGLKAPAAADIAAAKAKDPKVERAFTPYGIMP